ncbi:MAG: lysozyme inhibitor LprI family protein [Jannaschia sp.]
MIRTRFQICLFASMAVLIAAPARSEGPSFRCDGTLTAIERTICADPALAGLDLRMARLYRAQLARHLAVDDTRAAEGLRSDQAVWRSWRNTCPTATTCLHRRYEQRIVDLGGSDPAPSGPAAPVPRIRDGRSERVFPDGRIEWEALDGGARGTDFPDGSGTVALFSQSTPPSFPGLPSGFDGWGARVEQDLLAILDALLPPGDPEAYRALTAGLPYSDRILRHVRAIGFLTND